MVSLLMFWSLAVFLPVVANTMLDQILFKEYIVISQNTFLAF